MPAPILPAPKPRSPPSPRARSLPPTPVTPPPNPLPAGPDDDMSCKSVASDAPGSVESEAPSPKRRGSSKSRWSLSANLRSGRAAPSPKSSILSEGSATLVGSSSPPRFFSELALVESASAPSELSVQMAPPSPTRSSRNVRLPKVLKNLSKRMSSSRPRSESGASMSPAQTQPELKKLGAESSKAATDAQSDGRATAAVEQPRLAQPGHLRLHQNENAPSGEVFTTTFVNPFRLRSRRPKTAPGARDPVRCAT